MAWELETGGRGRGLAFCFNRKRGALTLSAVSRLLVMVWLAALLCFRSCV